MGRLADERALAAVSGGGTPQKVGSKDGAGLTPKQRAFVCLVVEGKSQIEAYRVAYGKPETFSGAACRSQASIVANKPHVKAEIDRMKAEIVARVRVAAAAKHAISVEYVIGALHEVAERCLQHRPVLDGKGKPVLVEVNTPDGAVEARALYTFDAKGAVQALVPLGKQLGMFIDRKEIRTGPLPDKSDAEIDEALTALLSDIALTTGLDPSQLLRQLNPTPHHTRALAAPARDVTPTQAATGGGARERDGAPISQ
jgi:hypothetical protein